MDAQKDLGVRHRSTFEYAGCDAVTQVANWVTARSP